MSGNEKTAKILGYAGLIPFITFTIASWMPLPYSTYAIHILLCYAAIILSFMGAIYWGVVMSGEQPGSKYFIASVIPALLAWSALLMPTLFAFAILIVGFIALIVFDQAVEKSLKFPGWYIPMRNILTSVVVLCLTAVLLSAGLK